ncbi:helix-turn-helix domain-containing protein [Gordonia sp. DT30]|uniref:helix-turn-helix domain-containing protein n=1 Tax=unclassified Gordonia (in: high G+C Gram-positive bacteria) TaxID=2657482 RepID=UPI003CEBEAB3
MRYMPSRNPAISDAGHAVLVSVGAAIRRRRRQLGVSAAVTAESAGMSRVTFHRIESGAASVTVGALVNAAEAVGLHIQLTNTRPQPEKSGEVETANHVVPEEVRVGDYPLLSAAAWQLDADCRLSGFEALRTYERNWRHLDHAAMGDEERSLIHALADKYSKGVLLV